MRGFYEAEPQSARRATRPGGLPSSRRSATTNSRSRRGHADRADAGAPGSDTSFVGSRYPGTTGTSAHACADSVDVVSQCDGVEVVGRDTPHPRAAHAE